MWRLWLGLVIVLLLGAVYAAFKMAVIGLGLAMMFTLIIWIGQLFYRWRK